MSVFSKNYRQAISEKVAAESFEDKPVGYVEGVALTVGKSRNNNIYSVAECKNVARKLINAPMFYEHVNATASIGRVTETSFDGYSVFYRAAIYDTESWNRIKTGTISKVSIGFNYEYAEPVNGQLMHNLDNLELSLVALGGVPNASIAPVKNEHLLPSFKITESLGAEHKGVESMEDVSLRDIIANTKKKANAAAIAEKDAAIEAQIRAKIEVENAAKNAAAAPTDAEQKITIKQFIETEIDRRLAVIEAAKKQPAEKPKEAGEK